MTKKNIMSHFDLRRFLQEKVDRRKREKKLEAGKCFGNFRLGVMNRRIVCAKKKMLRERFV